MLPTFWGPGMYSPLYIYICSATILPFSHPFDSMLSGKCSDSPKPLPRLTLAECWQSAPRLIAGRSSTKPASGGQPASVRMALGLVGSMGFKKFRV